MTLSDEQLANLNGQVAMAKEAHYDLVGLHFDDAQGLLDTISDLKRQLRERPRHYLDFLSILEDYQKMPRKEFDATHGDDISAALDAYVQEKVSVLELKVAQRDAVIADLNEELTEMREQVDRAVLAESLEWSARINTVNAEAWATARLAANRAKVKTS